MWCCRAGLSSPADPGSEDPALRRPKSLEPEARVSQELTKSLDRPGQLLAVPLQVRPQVTDVSDARLHRAQCERPWTDDLAFELVPGARRRDRRFRLRPHGVRRGKRRTVAVAARIDQDPVAAIHLRELLREVVRVAGHEEPARGVRESRDLTEAGRGIERHDYVEPFRP